VLRALALIPTIKDLEPQLVDQLRIMSRGACVVSRHFRSLGLVQGSSLCAVGLLAGLTLLVLGPRVRLFPVDLVFIFAGWCCFWFFSHDLAHHIVGRIVGVAFRYYFLGRSSITKQNLPIVSNF